MRTLIRFAGWSLIVTIFVLSVVPPSARPTTSVPHGMEHALIYLATGLAFGHGYAERARTAAVGLVAFSGVVELVQAFIPGRHARMSDFIIDAAASCLGVVVIWALAQARELVLKSK